MTALGSDDVTGDDAPPPPLVVPFDQVQDLLEHPLLPLIDAATIAVLTVDRDLVLRFTAGGWLRRWAPPVSKATIGDSMRKVWADRPDLIAHLTESAIHGRLVRVDLPSSGRVLDTTFQPIVTAETGEAVGVVAVGLDVTAERTATRRSESLAELGARELAAGDNLPQVLEAISSIAARYTQAFVSVRLVGDENTVSRVAVAHADDSVLQRMVAVMSDGSEAAAQAHYQQLLTARQAPIRTPLNGTWPSDPAADPARALLVELGATDELVWPLLGQSGLLGFLSILVMDGATPHLATSRSEHIFIGELATRAALHLESVQARLRTAQDEQRRARRASHLAVLAEFSRAAQATGGLAKVDLDRIIERTAVVLQGSVAVFRVENGQGLLQAHSNSDKDIEAIQRVLYTEPLADQNLWDRLAASRTPVIQIPNAAALVAARGQHWAEYAAWMATQQILWIPLEQHGERLGLLGVIRGDDLDEDEREFLTELGDRLALSSHNSRIAAERDHAMASLGESEAQFRSAFSHAPVGMFLGDMHPDHVGEIIQANDVFGALTGYPATELAGRSYRDLVHPDDLALDVQMFAEMSLGTRTSYRREKRYVRADGTTIWVRMSASLVWDNGVPSHVVAHVEDITEHRAAQDELAYRALYDSLTGLPNRHLTVDHLKLALSDLQDRPGRVAVLYVDLDRFKEINDTYGHEAGDQVLVTIANRIAAAVGVHDTPTRLGGDEFVVICRSVGSPQDLHLFVTRVLNELDAPLTIRANGTQAVVHVGASIGVAVTDDPDTDPEQLLHDADVAMYEAKNRGRHRYHVFAADLGATGSTRLRIEADIREALEYDRFVLHYQPVVDLFTGQIIGAEALLRLNHPERGLLMPVEFIDVAEDSPLIFAMGDWVLSEACQQLAQWQRLDICADEPLTMAVNVSGRQAADTVISGSVLRIAETFGVPPSSVCLEMTERTLLLAADSVVRELADLKHAGVRLAIDDFGTGHSSLTYLQQFPVDIVKIDRSFVAGLGENERDDAIVAAVTALGAALHLSVIAEGVETSEQARILRGLGCPLAQGYLFGRPVPAEEFTAALAKQLRSRAGHGAKRRVR